MRPIHVPGVEAFNTAPKVSSDARGGAYPTPEQQVKARAPASLREQGRLGAEGEDGAAKENVNVFHELQALRIGLLTGDADGIRNTLERFDQLHASVWSRLALNSDHG